MEHYITEIKIDELRHLSNITIELKKDRRTNLLLTGKNGSGKTTVLQAVKKYLTAITEEKYSKINNDYMQSLMRSKERMDSAKNGTERHDAQKNYEVFREIVNRYKEGIDVTFNNDDGLEALYEDGKYVLAYYSADRKTAIVKMAGVEEVILNTSYRLEENPGMFLHKYLVHLKTQQSYARNEGDMETVEVLEQWFSRFTEALKTLLDDPEMKLEYDYKNYNFQIIEEGRKPFGFDQLSDGYSAAIQIVADLILRMEQNWLKQGVLSTYGTEGIVLIDELETHLHIALQKKILPFLITFFPRIQFIVTTHSPYILNSIEECVIYDLEKQIRMEDMSDYSAEGIVEGYFGLGAYSEKLLTTVKRYAELVEKEDPTEEERAERARIRTELKQLSGDLSKEARDAFEEIEDKRKQHDKG